MFFNIFKRNKHNDPNNLKLREENSIEYKSSPIARIQQLKWEHKEIIRITSIEMDTLQKQLMEVRLQLQSVKQ